MWRLLVRIPWGLVPLIKDTDNATAVAEMRKGLDDNQDGKVSFQEYMTLMGYLAISLSDHVTSTMGAPSTEQKQDKKEEAE
ncbi:protein S100-A1 protein6-like [Scleropages formosus]|uniref:Protein S100-A1 protein6-like n=1 Tax=Scleropages formosus TaxID=113540 RepID=A0A0P7UVQ6_SCLFO|nr:protein S100-A1 protein6-like [Scleropages formosus]